ncbi:C1 family peptidase [Gimesia algae]|uniref:Papain family cysteine protease n=1 Tax=Gimesia algae TaxID=2527971 RepID=A0A517VBQ9_9PLAN|nr:C1 family peptidase [Gimesia algae]QDT90444.1 hypothetical protein Pan161_20960 [Gimesia algae]
MSTFIPQGMGWIPDLPDARDFTCTHDAVVPLLRRLKKSRRKEPDEVDLRGESEIDYFTLTENQGPLNCSTSHAVLSLVEYYERRIRGQTFEGSIRFLYKVTRNHIQKRPHARGDTGADLRTTLKMLTHFGVPPTEHCPYDVSDYDEEPSAFLYRLAKPFPGLHYLRLDQPNQNGEKTWRILKSFLAAGFPVVFGFPVPSSLTAADIIPFRPDLDSIRGGQAVVAVGYRLNHLGRGKDAVLIRSSWGSEWGDNGNGWLPAAYLHKQLARDFWTLVCEQWLDPQELSLPKEI